MRIWVCSLSRAAELVRYHKPEKIMSLLGHGEAFPNFENYGPARHLKVFVDDVSHDMNDRAEAPEIRHAQEIIDFAAAWTRATPILVHCHAGVSRSSAAAFIMACALNPLAPPEDIAIAIRRQSLTARPNKRLVDMADKLLNRRGEMLRAVEMIEDSWEFHPEVDVMPYRVEAYFGEAGGHV